MTAGVKDDTIASPYLRVCSWSEGTKGNQCQGHCRAACTRNGERGTLPKLPSVRAGRCHQVGKCFLSIPSGALSFPFPNKESVSVCSHCVLPRRSAVFIPYTFLEQLLCSECRQVDTDQGGAEWKSLTWSSACCLPGVLSQRPYMDSSIPGALRSGS